MNKENISKRSFYPIQYRFYLKLNPNKKMKEHRLELKSLQQKVLKKV